MQLFLVLININMLPHYHLVKMLHGRMEKENLFIEVEYTSVKKQNPLVESIFSGYKDIPVSYQSVANQPHLFSLSTLRPWIAICPTM